MKEEAALARTVIKKRLAGQPAPDIWFLIILMLLVCYGLVMLFSAGYAVALYRRGDAYTYIRPQLLFAAFGAAAMYAASLVDYHIWHKLAWPIMGVSLALLAIVLFMPEYNGCKRWIVLPGLGTLQPSEIAKFAVVLVFAHIISLNHDRMQTFATGVLPFMVILGAVTVLMLLEPHLSGTLLILGIGAVLMLVGGTGLKWFALAGIAGAGAIAAAVVLLPELVPYAMGRLSSWRDPFADPLGEGHQTIQSLYAIASGGAAGLGLGNSRQKYLYVPEPQNDFIFSILCEELGFVGAALTVVLFLLLFLRGMSIAVRARDKFGALLAVGFVVQVVLQAVLNIAVVTNTIPNTGISLPFFSSGGTSLMMLLGEMGIVLSVSRQADAGAGVLDNSALPVNLLHKTGLHHFRFKMGKGEYGAVGNVTGPDARPFLSGAEGAVLFYILHHLRNGQIVNGCFEPVGAFDRAVGRVGSQLRCFESGTLPLHVGRIDAEVLA